MNEDQLLLRALRDVNVPKFLKDDLPLFENIILDLFPGVDKPIVNYGDLFTSLNNTCETFNLQPVDQFIMKIIQLYDTIQVRHGLMIVGPTGGAKTSNYKCLQHAMSTLCAQEMFEKVHVDILNPKAITMDQLYGFVDPQTSEWQDGVLAKLVVDCTKDESPDLHWVMFDGPVDAIWIENMNTVLDDNKKLCLNSGQIITLSNRMTMMFEVEDLSVASPATVSRCGMVYMEPSSLTLAPLVVSWINQIPPKVKESKMISARLPERFDMILVDACYFVRKNVFEPVKTVDNNLTQSLMRIIDCYFSNYIENEVKRITKDQIAELESMLNHIFLFATIWSIGITGTIEGRITFDKWLREKIPDIGVSNFPEEGMVYDYKWNPETKEWQNWMTTISEYETDIKASYNEILVPTLDSIRMKFMVKMLIANSKHCLTPGPTGVGKSVNINELMTYELTEEY
jgi:dynein heavy chain